MEKIIKRYKQNPDYVYRRIVDEMILVPLHNDIADMDCIYSLNALGAFIWEKLETPSTRDALEKSVLESFETNMEEVRQDLDEFIMDMLHHGAIREEV